MVVLLIDETFAGAIPSFRVETLEYEIRKLESLKVES